MVKIFQSRAGGSNELETHLLLSISHLGYSVSQSHEVHQNLNS
ncbi:hypothetical protein [Microcystis aeruginosa]|nr:hypothetical protein [Microcystis aeruginosa]MDB9416817.1 hypothetical protein [Microcystis aeruginosa CS-556/03]